MANQSSTANRIHVEVVTPKGLVLSKEADEITAPGLLGEFGVLPDHIGYLSALKPGVLTIRDGQNTELVAVGRGYAEVGAENKVVILVDRAAEPADIDQFEAKTELDRLQGELKAATEGHATLNYEANWQQARLDAYTAARGSHRN